MTNKLLDEITIKQLFEESKPERRYNYAGQQMLYSVTYSCGDLHMKNFIQALHKHWLASQSAEVEALKAQVSAAVDVATKLATLAQHGENCSWNESLPTGMGHWHCSCGLDSLVLDGELLDDLSIQEPCCMDK